MKWGDLEVGDFIVLKQDEMCPADILILDASENLC